MKKYSIIFFFITIFFSNSLSKENSKKILEEKITSAISNIYHLQFNDAEQKIQNIISEYPLQPEGYFFYAMVTWWKIMLNKENRQFDNEYFLRLEKSIEICDKLLEKNKNDIIAKFYKGGAFGYRGRLEVHRKYWFSAIRNGQKGLSLMKEAYENDKINSDIFLGIGLYLYYAEAIPEQYPIIRPLMWFVESGNKRKGIEFLLQVKKNGKFSNIEAAYFLLQIYTNYEKNYEEGLKIAEELFVKYPERSDSR